MLADDVGLSEPPDDDEVNCGFFGSNPELEGALPPSLLAPPLPPMNIFGKVKISDSWAC